MRKALIFLLVLLFASFVYANTHVAVSLSQSDIQNAVDAASEGDIVSLPAGTNTNYSGTVLVEINSLWIRGAGKTSTIGHSDVFVWVQPEKKKPKREPCNPKYLEYVVDNVGKAMLNMPIKQGSDYVPPKQNMEELDKSMRHTNVGPRAYGTLFALSGAYPDVFDWRNADDGNSAVTPHIGDQGDCTVCWAFATIECLESQILGPSNGSVLRPGAVFDLSEEYIKNCNKFARTCGGSTFHHSMAHLSTIGVPLESCLPYTDSPAECTTTCPERFIALGYRYVAAPDDEATLKQAIYDYGPVKCVIDAVFDIADGETFIDDYDGICVASTTETDTNHDVMVFGWGQTEMDICSGGTSTDYWILKNHYGSDWGDSGYFYLEMSSANDAGLGNFWRISDWKYWDENETLYHYDECGWQGQYGYSGEGGDETIAYGLVKYTASANHTVHAVGIYFVNGDSCDYTIYLYDGFDGSTLGNLLTSQEDSKSVGVAGLEYIPLTTPQTFGVGDDIVIVVKFDYNTYEYPIGVDDEDTDYCDIESAKTFMSQTGASDSWTDMGSENSVDIGIRAFAVTIENGPKMGASPRPLDSNSGGGTMIVGRSIPHPFKKRFNTGVLR